MRSARAEKSAKLLTPPRLVKAYGGPKNTARQPPDAPFAAPAPPSPPAIPRYILATPQELSDFLASVERRAFKQAIFATQNEETSLHLVQDAMLKLAESYGEGLAAAGIAAKVTAPEAAFVAGVRRLAAGIAD